MADVYKNLNECRARYSNILFLQIDFCSFCFLFMATNEAFYNHNRQDDENRSVLYDYDHCLSVENDVLWMNM